MNTLTTIIVVVLWLLFGWGLLIGMADAMLRRRDADLLEMRRWQETVDAMRRMADREGQP